MATAITPTEPELTERMKLLGLSAPAPADGRRRGVLDRLRAICPRATVDLEGGRANRRATGRRPAPRTRARSRPTLPTSALLDLPFLTVTYRDGFPTSGMATKTDLGWVVVIKGDEPTVRQRFSLAHEIKHIIDDDLMTALAGGLYPATALYCADERAERVADRFAAALLMPKDAASAATGWTACKTLPCSHAATTSRDRPWRSDCANSGCCKPTPRCAAPSASAPPRSATPMRPPRRAAWRAPALAKALIYLRVSSTQQAEKDYDAEGYSLPAQRTACLRKADSLEAVVERSSSSAASPARPPTGPALQRMLARLTAGRHSLRHRAQGRPAGSQPRRRCRHRHGHPPIRRHAGVGQREHRRDAVRPAAARHHELDRRVLLARTSAWKSRRARPRRPSAAARRSEHRSATSTSARSSTDARSAPSPSTPTAARWSPKPSGSTPPATTRCPSSAPSSKPAACAARAPAARRDAHWAPTAWPHCCETPTTSAPCATPARPTKVATTR